ncbi:MAG TPA: serine acetyltransferase [Candidatus Binataceae bacterium]|nr:serine acetyltransferase [Candidatus Binataceae bacterium]
MPSTALVIKVFDNLREDWVTHERDLWRQGIWVMAVYRFGRWRYEFRSPVIRKPLSLAYKVLRTLSQMLTGIELPCETTVGKRFKIEHFGSVIISGDAVFGDDVIVRNGVTIGLRHTGVPGAPVIGNRVDIGAGAKILGPIKIGDDVAIGANAVVISDVPADSIAVGIPARMLPRKTKVSLLPQVTRKVG